MSVRVAAGAGPAGLAAARALARAHWPLLAVLGAFLATTLALPTLANVAILDDWVYADGVERLVHHGELTVHPLSGATFVAQELWGALFAGVFGMSFGVLRVSTLVLVAVGAVFFHALLRELGVSRAASALGTAIYLFNPLLFVLSYTFMTDAPVTSLVVVAAYLFVCALRPDELSSRLLVLGSAASAAAMLIRPQAALLPVGVLGYLVAARLVRGPRRTALRALEVAGIPVAAAAAFAIWRVSSGAKSTAQGWFLSSIRDAGFGHAWVLSARVLYVVVVYVGLFLVPLAVGAVPQLVRLARSTPAAAWAAVAAWVVLVFGGIANVLPWRGATLPYAAAWLTVTGPGVNTDLAGADRHPLFGGPSLAVITVVAILASFVVVLVAARGLALRQAAERRPATLLLVLAVLQAVGVLAPAFYFDGPQDRYLLPVLPLALALVLWALRDVPVALVPAGAVTVLVAAFAVLGTRDFLVREKTVWQVAERAHAGGVPYDRLEGGAGWDGFHAYGLPPPRSKPSVPAGFPTYLAGWGPAIDPEYAVAAAPVDGYHVVRDTTYRAFLWPGTTRHVYLLRRN